MSDRRVAALARALATAAYHLTPPSYDGGYIRTGLSKVAALVRAWFFGICCLSVYCLLSQSASASCNQIPGTSNFFRGTRGSLDRPFAGPGDRVEITLSPACDAESSGFAANEQQIVSVVFTPASGRRHVVVVAPDCNALAGERQRCSTLTDAPAFTCIPSASAIVRENDRQLRFDFPDTDNLLDSADDDRTLAGPAAIAVTGAGEPLPCDLGQTTCRDHTDLAACIDTLFTVDGTCGTSADTTFGHFTALPVPNDYQALCTNPIPPCTGRATEFRFTTDADGNILIPMDWRGILVGQSVPIARLLRTTFAPEAFPGGGEPIHLPSNAFLHSYSPQGGLLPPIFEPQTDASAQNELVLFGSADAPTTVLRLARRSPLFKECGSGSLVGQPCTEDAECGDGSCAAAHCDDASQTECRSNSDCGEKGCGRPLFDFASRAIESVGPVVVARFGSGVCQDTGVRCDNDAACGHSRCVAYRTEAKDPVPLEGLIESKDVFVSVVPEAIDGRDLNGDGDAIDDVLLLADRKSGERAPIGEDLSPGRAATRLHQPPFSFPGVYAAGDIVAFLEPEPLQGYRDENGDGDHFDTILRIYRLVDGTAQELTAGRNLAVDAAPMINSQSIAFVDGQVLFRRRESASARRRIVRASVDNNNSPANGASQRPSLSRDGKHLAFESAATNLSESSTVVDAPTSFVRDLKKQRTMRIEISNDAIPPNEPVRSPWVSGDGRYIAAAVRATNGFQQIVVYDRDQDANGILDEPNAIGSMVVTLQQTLAGTDVIADRGDSGFPSLSPDGRFVVYPSLDPYLTNGGPIGDNGAIYRLDRDKDGNGQYDEDPATLLLNAVAGATSASYQQVVQPAAISDDGRWTAFTTIDRNLAAGDNNDFCLNFGISGANGITCSDVILTQDNPRAVTLQTRSSAGEQANNHSVSPVISADGGVIAFESAATNLVAGDTNGAFDVFVRDVEAQATTRVSVSSEGVQGNAASFSRAISMSADGRFIAFSSRASNLTRDDTNSRCASDDGTIENCADVFVHDRLTGFTERISATGAGIEGNGRSSYPALSGDGATVAFESDATNLAEGSGSSPMCDGVPCTSILLAGPDSDAANDLSGDGDVDDTVLETLNLSRPEGGSRMISSAGAVATAGNLIAFLVPESPGNDLNGDGDTNDQVVHLYRNGEVINLHRSAIDVAMSERAIAVRTVERDEGHTNLNNDDDLNDSVVAAYDLESNTWINIARGSDRTPTVRDDAIIIQATERQDQLGYNGDGVDDDDVLEVYFLAAHRLLNTHLEVDDLVAAGGFVAFRTGEAAQGNKDLNGDGDTTDHVLHIFDLATGNVTNTEQAAIPCRLAACDPRVPYRIAGGMVKFLTLEQEQNEDLNGDGDMSDLVLQTLNIALAKGIQQQARSHREHMRASRSHRAAPGMDAGAFTTIGAVSAGICTNTGRACATAADCGTAGRCFVPPGGCIEKLSQSCDTLLGDSGCNAGEFCVPSIVPGKGACHIRRGPCSSDADCTAPARCQDANQSFQQLVAPLGNSNRGGEVFTTACEGAACDKPLLVAAAGDADGDGIADPFDNCARVANPGQEDRNGNGVGDACETTPTPVLTKTATATAALNTATPSATVMNSDTKHDGCAFDASPTWQPVWLIATATLFAVHRLRRPRTRKPA